MIVGIDPGTTVGLAVLDLRGNLLHLSSRKGADDSWIFDTIRRYGVPVVVATDKASVPSRVKKIAAQLGARLWVPKEDISVETKEEVARRFSYGHSGPEDDHQRDALTAAFLAFQSFAPKFRQVEKRVENDREQEEFVKKAVIFGQSMDRAIREYHDAGRAEEKTVERQPVKREKTDVSTLLKRIAELKAELREKDRIIEELRSRVRELEEEVEKLRRRPVLKDEEIEKLRMQRDEARRRASRYQRQVRKLEKILEKIAEGKYSVKKGSGGGKQVYRTEKVSVVEPEEKTSEEELAERIARLIEEYRAGKK